MNNDKILKQIQEVSSIIENNKSKRIFYEIFICYYNNLYQKTYNKNKYFIKGNQPEQINQLIEIKENKELLQELLYTSPTPIIHDKYQDISHDMVNKMNKILRDIVLKRGHLITYIYYEREIQNYFDNIYYQNKNEDQICTMIYNTIVQYINELIELTGLKDISKLITVDELKDINIPLDNLLKLNIKDDETNIDKLKEIAGIINNYAPNINHIINYIKISNQIRKEISYFKLYSESLATSGVSKLSTSLLKKQKDEYNSELLSLSERYQDAKSLSENKYNRQLLLLDIEKNKILKNKLNKN